MRLRTDVLPGDPGHATLHNEERAILNTVEDLYSREILHELPFRFPSYATAVTAMGGGGSGIYPQAFAVYEDRIYIQFANGNGPQWISVYDLEAGTYLRGFVLNTTTTVVGAEGLVVRREADGQLYLFAKLNNAGDLGKFDIDPLPAEAAVLSSIQSWAVGIYTSFTYGTEWAFGQRTSVYSSGRNRFDRYSPSLATWRSRLQFDPADYWTVGAGETTNALKPQGLAEYRGGYAVGYGTIFNYGVTAPTPDRRPGIRLFDGSGNAIAHGIMDPTKFIDILRANGYVVDTIENEGLSTYNNTLYAMWVTSNYEHPHGDVGGLLITRELGGSLDCSAAATVGAQPRIYAQSGQVLHSATGIKNPLTGALFTTLEQVIEYMRMGSLNRFGFYASDSTIKDFAGVTFPAGTFVTIVTGNFYTWRVELSTTEGLSTLAVTGAKGALTQTRGPVAIGGTLPTTGEAVTVGPGNAGKLQIRRPGTGALGILEFNNDNGLVGFVQMNGTATRYYLSSNRWVSGGAGSPAGVVTAPPGCMWLRSDGGAGSTMYVKESGTDASGWVAK